jgi:hypothetical protein
VCSDDECLPDDEFILDYELFRKMTIFQIMICSVYEYVRVDKCGQMINVSEMMNTS